MLLRLRVNKVNNALFFHSKATFGFVPRNVTKDQVCLKEIAMLVYLNAAEFNHCY